MVASTIIPAQDLSIFQTVPKNISASLTIPVTPIDPRFRITVFDGPDTPLNQKSLLMTAINEMGKLALLDWNGQIKSFRSQRIPGYSDVSIVVRVVPPAQRIDTRIAVWGLYAAIESMSTNDKFEAKEYSLFWGNSQVGVLRFHNIAASQYTPRGEQNESQSSDLILPTLPSLANSFGKPTKETPSSANITEMLKEHVLVANCHYLPDAESLTFGEVLLPIISAMRNVAAVPKTSFMDSAFVAQPAGMEAKVIFAGRSGGPVGRRTGTYQYKWVIRVLYAIPSFFFMNDRFAEMYVNIIVDGVYLGVGMLDKREVESISVTGRLPPDAIVSIS